MLKNIFSFIICVSFVVGCAPSAKKMSTNMNNASLGMTKAEVIDSMGQPQSTSAIHGVEYLMYKLCTTDGDFMHDYKCGRWEDFYVRLKDGKVDSYGTKGDFDSTKIPESKRTIDLNIDHK